MSDDGHMITGGIDQRTMAAPCICGSTHGADELMAGEVSRMTAEIADLKDRLDKAINENNTEASERLRVENDDIKARMKKSEAELYSIKLPCGMHAFGPHTLPDQCTTWHDGCHCTVETLVAFETQRDAAIARAEKAEAERAKMTEAAVRLLEEAHRALSWSPHGPDRDLAARIQPFIHKHQSAT